MALQCKQVTVTSALEFTLFYQGCLLKPSAGYKVGKLEQLENLLLLNSIGPVDRREKTASSHTETQRVHSQRGRERSLAFINRVQSKK